MQSSTQEQQAVSRANRHYVDFHRVRPHHREIDRRLHNWGAYCHGSSGGGMQSPMWRMIPRSPSRVASHAYGMPGVDSADAGLVQAMVQKLPELQRLALGWCYCKPCAPKRICRELGLSMQGLALTLDQARDGLMAQRLRSGKV